MDDRVSPRLYLPDVDRVHICDRCGERMEERKCKIVCGNCGMTRDCSDP